MPQAVSVVIPTYNGAAYIEEALASVFAQTAWPAEVIVVDDCSPDGTADVVQGLARTAPLPVRLLRCEQNSGGPALPMNLGVEAAASEVVAFLDQDDIMCEAKVEQVSAAFEKKNTGVGLAFGQIRLMDKVGELQPPVVDTYDIFPKDGATLGPAEVFFSIVNHDYRFGGAGGTAVLKRAWQDLGGFNPRFSVCWDRDFALRLALRGWSVAYLPHEFFYHRVHESNLERAESGARCYCEATQVLLEAFHGSHSLPAEWRSSLVTALQARVQGAAYWERRRGRYSTALRFYWFAARHGFSLAAAAGIIKVGLAACLHPIRGRCITGSLRS